MMEDIDSKLLRLGLEQAKDRIRKPEVEVFRQKKRWVETEAVLEEESRRRATLEGTVEDLRAENSALQQTYVGEMCHLRLSGVF